MQLFIGGGTDYQEGYVNLDICQKPCDVRGDIRHFPFADNSFISIDCHHVLEHLGRDDAVLAAGEFLRVLCPGGQLCLSVPDIIGVIRAIMSGEIDWAHGIEMFYGKQDYEANTHHWGYWGGSLKELMEGCGFVTMACKSGMKYRPSPTIVYIGRKP